MKRLLKWLNTPSNNNRWTELGLALAFAIGGAVAGSYLGWHHYHSVGPSVLTGAIGSLCGLGIDGIMHLLYGNPI